VIDWDSQIGRVKRKRTEENGNFACLFLFVFRQNLN
jgi:hypothetical protein